MRPRADTLLVWTGGSCVYGCPACPIDRQGAPDGLEPAALQQRLTGVEPGRLVVLVGGDPFLRKDLLRLLAVIRAADCLPGIVTTGRALLYPQWRERLRRAGVAYLRVQMFGAGAAHDRAVAVPGAFEQAMDGLRAWLAESDGHCDVDLALSSRCRADRQLVAEVEQLAATGATGALHVLVAIDAADDIDRPFPADLGAAVQGLANWNDDPTRPFLAWEGAAGLPFGAALRVAPPAPAFLGVAPPASCLGSSAALASDAAPPAEQTRANSFNYVRSGREVAATARAEDCAAAEAGAGVEPLRQVWLIEDGRLAQHVTDTGDFSAAEIATIKDVHSHLFVDRAAAGVLDDIVEGMRRVRPEPICAGCARRAACGRRVRLIDEPPFARQEAWIRAHVAGLRGRVLDVGCGEQPYHDVLAPLMRAGVLDYTGLDPDQPSLDRARAALPGGRFWLGGIEDLRGAPASYQHLLCLRSLNHVFDLDEAFARMAWLLEPGGSLLLIETTPFAMLRRAEQVAAADRAPRAGHQHFRNVSSQEVLPHARRRGLRVVEHQPADLAGTNQWILLLQREQG